jgi:hypothetical protein
MLTFGSDHVFSALNAQDDSMCIEHPPISVVAADIL